jgi:hypothetical protein
MEKPQSVHPAAQKTDILNSTAKSVFSDFLKQIPKPQSKGFISEGNSQKIFSFERYLRETGRSEELIDKYCNFIKAHHAEEAAAEKKSQVFILTDYRSLVKVLLISMIPGIVLYGLIAAFLWTFEISFLEWKTCILFALSSTFLMALSLSIQYLRLKRNERLGIVQTEYIIKCFDSDELTYLKNKNKLFVEK